MSVVKTPTQVAEDAPAGSRSPPLVQPHELVQLAGEDVVVALLDDHESTPAIAEVLDLEPLVDPVLRALAADAGLLHAAERRDLGRDEAGVDADDAVVERLRDAPDAADVAAVEVRGEAVRRVVRDARPPPPRSRSARSRRPGRTSPRSSSPSRAVTPASTVGSKNVPPSACARRRAASSAPRSSASVDVALDLRRAPAVVDQRADLRRPARCRGRPSASTPPRRAARRTRRRSPSWTRIRLAEMQVWPRVAELAERARRRPPRRGRRRRRR